MVLWPKKVWNNKDFETFFEGHYEEWDFDAKKLGSIICCSPIDHLEVFNWKYHLFHIECIYSNVSLGTCTRIEDMCHVSYLKACFELVRPHCFQPPKNYIRSLPSVHVAWFMLVPVSLKEWIAMTGNIRLWWYRASSTQMYVFFQTVTCYTPENTELARNLRNISDKYNIIPMVTCPSFP